MGWLDGQVALITGGGSGIGRAVVNRFVNEGARVAVLEIDEAKAQALRQDLGAACHVTCGNVTSMSDNKRAVAEALDKFGSIDTLICMAGVWDRFTGVLDLPDDAIDSAFDELFSVNVKGNLLAVRAAVEPLLKSRGNIIFTLSNSAFYAGGGGPLYTASKFAVRGLVKQFAYELAPTIRVNGVAPGGTRTMLRGLKALGHDKLRLMDTPDLKESIEATCPLQICPEADDHAWAYVYLAAANKSLAVTGNIIHSDGGLGVRGLNKLAGLLPGGYS
ncbi:MAG: 3-(cis-5,6-dihydroxycyclohexa-1,3-dien-1-yl)propanoate dehydrogenase [Steroidobacteraceae bacterium]